ncbi:MAG: GNAT family N-acetyltransferase [Candidatus Bathyarchaeia archaeon]
MVKSRSYVFPLMVDSVKIREYRAGDEEPLVNIWNEYFRKDPLTLKVFERKVLLDPNFDESGLKIAELNGEIVGFLIGIVRRYPLFYHGLEDENGWITAIAVKPELTGAGAADHLMAEAFKFFKEKKRKYVWFSPYTPNYFFPGVDPERYGELLALLVRHGFEKTYEALSMDAQLYPDYSLPDWVAEAEKKLKEEGVEIQPLETRYIYPLLKFIGENFHADWYRHALELLQSGCDKDQILIAVKHGEVVGYCQYFHSEEYDWYRPGTHFGPFGVREDLRGRGIGSVLMAKCLQDMRSRGFHSAFLLWTDKETAKFYSRFGFKVSRRFYIMRKVL